jgi:hypothetical protein
MEAYARFLRGLIGRLQVPSYGEWEQAERDAKLVGSRFKG